MAKRKAKKQVHSLLHTSSIIAITICIISIGLLIATCVNVYFVNKQQAKNIENINKLVIQISSNPEFTTENALEDIYLSYYNAIDQKATDSINTALSFFGFIFSLITIVNTIIAVKMPKQFEDSLFEIDNRIKEVERHARESTNAVHYVNAVSSKKTTKEKIGAITAVIEDYGDNSGEFYFSRGFLYDDIKDYDNAKADYTRARKAGGSEYTYHNSMGVLYSNIMTSTTIAKDKKQAFKKAEQHYKKAIKLIEDLDEKADYCHCNLACLYQDYAKALKGWAIIDSGDFSFKGSEEFKKYTELALAEFDQAIYINEDFLTAYLNRGISYLEMGEDFYQNAYEDFQRCYKIDPENKEVLEFLSKTALSLLQKTNDKEYYYVAKVNINKLREDINRIELLTEKLNAIEPPKAITDNFDPNKLLAKIDEKIGDLSLEEANENIDDPAEYGNSISEALEHFKSSLKMYQKLYSTSQSDDYQKAVERLQDKISSIEQTESPIEI